MCLFLITKFEGLSRFYHHYSLRLIGTIDTKILFVCLLTTHHFRENTTRLCELIRGHISELRSCADAIANCAQHQKVITNDVLSISKLEVSLHIHEAL